MIERKRLEELIEQGATVWEVVYAFKDFFVEKYDLKEIPTFCKKRLDIFEDLHEVFETKEEAEWYKEFGNIERIERLVLPTWEELFKQDRLLGCYTQEFAIIKNRSFIGVVLFGVDFTNKIIEVSIGSDKLFVEELTQENYTLACRKAKELFLGGKDE